jgi:hypothetical protein
MRHAEVDDIVQFTGSAGMLVCEGDCRTRWALTNNVCSIDVDCGLQPAMYQPTNY